MSLGRKITLLFAMLAVSIAAGSYVAIRTAVLPAFEQFERESSVADLKRVERLIAAQSREFGVLNREYAHWDETYRFALGQQPEYIVENLDAAYWHSLGIHLIAVLDRSGDVLWSALLEPTDGTPLEFDDYLLEPLGLEHPLVGTDLGDAVEGGLLKTRAAPLLVSSQPILTTYSQGPPVGRFILGRFLIDEQIARYAEQTGTDLRMRETTSDDPSGRAAESIRQIRNGEFIVTRQSLFDVLERPVGTVEVRTPRRITAVGYRGIYGAVFFIALITGVFLLVSVVFLRGLVVEPVNELSEQMTRIRLTGEMDFTADESRSDEIGDLGREFGRMTSRLREARDELEGTRDLALEASRAKSEFLARMSHEIRTPMNGVFGMTELLGHTTLDAKQRRFAETIRRSAEQLLAIINDILDFSKIEAGKLELESVDVDVRSIVEEILDNVTTDACRKGLELINGVSHDIPPVLRSDPVRLRQVLTNLVANAVKFTDEGEVVVRVDVEAEDGEALRLRFQVSDTGIGIAPENQKRVFESFAQEDSTATRAHGGTGLGLAISKQLVDLMGGELGMTSVPGKGSIFEFSLRMTRGADDDDSLARARELAGRHILIVDDIETNREILEEQLGGCLARTRSASSALEALALMEDAAAAGTPFEIAIVDVHMPDVDGLELARRVRSKTELDGMKMVLLSSVATPASDKTMRELNIAAQLAKPIRQTRLYGSLISILGTGAAEEEDLASGLPSHSKLAGRVLLVEDNLINQAVVLGMLESLGVTPEVAGQGREAVDRVQEESFDLVLMDCQMPVLDGYAATREIRLLERAANRRPVPIVALTADAIKGDREKCLEAGMNDYLSKPFTMKQLEGVLGGVLGSETNLAASPPGPSVDRTVWEDLAKLRADGAASLLEKTLRLYVTHSEAMKEGLREAVESGDAVRIRQSAHALKSSSANVGATVLAELCLQLETMAREEALSEARSVEARVDEEYQRVMAVLHEELEQNVRV